jgi:hypothetical protein
MSQKVDFYKIEHLLKTSVADPDCFIPTPVVGSKHFLIPGSEYFFIPDPT